MDKHDLHCKEIAERLEKYASGDYFEYDDDLYPMDGDDFNECGGCEYYLDDDGFYYYCIGDDKINEFDVEPATLYDYFYDYLDVDYIVDSNKELKAVRVMVACGGPNIYIDTWNQEVQLYWWTETGKYPISYDVCDGVNEVFELIWGC